LRRGDHQGRHQNQAVVANLAEFVLHRLDMGTEIFGELDQMRLLALALGTTLSLAIGAAPLVAAAVMSYYYWWFSRLV
jgi:hypothetical protein